MRHILAVAVLGATLLGFTASAALAEGNSGATPSFLREQNEVMSSPATDQGAVAGGDISQPVVIAHDQEGSR